MQVLLRRGLALHERPAALSGGVDVVEGLAVRNLALEKAEHLLIHAARAETAPEGRDKRTLIRQAELLARLRAREREEVPGARAYPVTTTFCGCL